MDNNPRIKLQLLAFANKQNEMEKTNLEELIINRECQVVDKALSTAWEMAEAEATLERVKLQRMEILNQTRPTGGLCPGL